METEDVTLERRPTGMRLSPQGRDAKRATSLPIFEAPRFVTVRTLFDLGSNTSSYKLRASDMAIETSGYWKTLPIGSEGRDKMDRPVQGRTWVTTQSSWFESRNAAVRSTTAPATVEPLWSDEDVGYLYVMRNAVHPRDVYKIGYTAKSVDQRADQLGATTGQPDMFNIVQRWSIRSPRVIEHEVHALLADHRVNDRREFFKLRYERIRETIEQVIEKTGARWDA